jgi:hypothetical protein
MDHVKSIDTGKLTLPQKHIFRKWAEILNSSCIVMLYFANSSDEYAEIYKKIIKTNGRYAKFYKITVPNSMLNDFKFLDITSIPSFVFYKSRCKLVHLSGTKITEKTLQKYIDNILYHSTTLGIKN